MLRYTLMAMVFISYDTAAQQLIPIELLAEPEKYSFAISGILTGNVDENRIEVDHKKSQTSGKIFLDAYITPNLFTSIHINAVKKSFLNDSLHLPNLSFIHNDYKFNFSLGWKMEGKYNFYQVFFDYSISEMDFIKQFDLLASQYNFNVFKLNLGIQAFWKADWDQHLIVNAALKLNHMWVENNPNDPAALHKVFGYLTDEHLIRKYNGFSFKTTIQLNTIAIFCETQKNFAAYNFKGGKTLPGYTNHTYYSIGFSTTSTAILGRKKETPVVPEIMQKEITEQLETTP